MPDIFNFNKETKDYFNTLPKYIQESVMQSSIKIDSKTDLERLVKSLNDSQ